VISCIVLDIRLNLVLYDVVPSCSQKFPGAAYAPPVFASLHSLLLSFVSSLSFSLLIGQRFFRTNSQHVLYGAHSFSAPLLLEWC